MSQIKTTNKKPFWSNKWGSDKICPITYTRLRPGKSSSGTPYIIKLSCGHRFCRNALLQWLVTSRNYSCPVCRNKIKTLR